MDDACYCDYDPAEFIAVETRRARKMHRCSECAHAISPGETYRHIRGKWDGMMYTFRQCPRCLDLIAYVEAHIPCFCWAYASMIDDAVETIREFEWEAPGLGFGARRRLVAIKRAPRCPPGFGSSSRPAP